MVQVFVADSIIIVASMAICYLVNFSESFSYAPNTHSFIDFNIWCGLIMVQGLISFLFLSEMDVMEWLQIQEFYPYDNPMTYDNDKNKTASKKTSVAIDMRT